MSPTCRSTSARPPCDGFPNARGGRVLKTNIGVGGAEWNDASTGLLQGFAWNASTSTAWVSGFYELTPGLHDRGHSGIAKGNAVLTPEVGTWGNADTSDPGRWGAHVPRVIAAGDAFVTLETPAWNVARRVTSWDGASGEMRWTAEIPSESACGQLRAFVATTEGEIWLLGTLGRVGAAGVYVERLRLDAATGVQIDFAPLLFAGPGLGYLTVRGCGGCALANGGVEVVMLTDPSTQRLVIGEAAPHSATATGQLVASFVNVEEAGSMGLVAVGDGWLASWPAGATYWGARITSAFALAWGFKVLEGPVHGVGEDIAYLDRFTGSPGICTLDLANGSRDAPPGRLVVPAAHGRGGARGRRVLRHPPALSTLRPRDRRAAMTPIQPRNLREFMISIEAKMDTGNQRFDGLEEGLMAVNEQLEALAAQNAKALELLDLAQKERATQAAICKDTRAGLFGDQATGKRGTIRKMWAAIAAVALLATGGAAEDKLGFLGRIATGVEKLFGFFK